MFYVCDGLMEHRDAPFGIIGFALASLALFFGKSTRLEPGKNHDRQKI
jgi:hypothetical protein